MKASHKPRHRQPGRQIHAAPGAHLHYRGAARSLALASLPERIRGYGHLRSRSMASARSRAQELLTRSTPAA